MIDALVYHRNVIDCFTKFEMILDFVRENDFFENTHGLVEATIIGS